MLQRAQELAIAFKQKRTIRTDEFDDDLRALSEFGIHRRIGADAVLQAKSSQLDSVTEDFVNASGCGNSILDRHGWGGGHLCELLNNISNIVPLTAPPVPRSHRETVCGIEVASEAFGVQATLRRCLRLWRARERQRETGTCQRQPEP